MKKGYLVSGFSKWVTANPWWVLLLVIMTASGAGLGLSQLGFKNNYRVYFGEDNPQLKAFDAISAAVFISSLVAS